MISSPDTNNAIINPVFSICIPAYKDKESIERAITSLRMQTVSSWECIVGDDSGNDSLNSLFARICDKRIKYILNTSPKGVPENWNFLISLARGQYITLMHHDDFYVNSTVLAHVLSALQNSNSQFAICAYSKWKSNIKLGLYNNKRNIMKFYKNFPQRSLIINRVGHPSVVFFRNTLQNVLFDKKLCYFLDTDWYARLWEAGGEPVYVSNAEIGIENGRNFQLSQKCIHNFSSIDHELEEEFNKWNISSTQKVSGFARLYASHARNIRRAWPSFRRRAGTLSTPQKFIFYILIFTLLWHMGYRALRKGLGLKPWA